MSTGLYLHGAIMAALHARERSGHGQRVDASLFETQISLLTNIGMSWLNLGIEAERWGCQHPSIVPYDAFKTKDLYIVCGATNDAQFATLCKLLGLENLIIDGRFATNPKRVENRDLIGPIMNAVFEKKTTAEWLEIFDGKGLAHAPINNMERTFSHPQAEARNMISRTPLDAAESGEVKLIGPAVKFSENAARIRSQPPCLGEHTDEVLNELGVNVATAKELRDQEII